MLIGIGWKVQQPETNKKIILVTIPRSALWLNLTDEKKPEQFLPADENWGVLPKRKTPTRGDPSKEKKDEGMNSRAQFKCPVSFEFSFVPKLSGILFLRSLMFFPPIFFPRFFSRKWIQHTLSLASPAPPSLRKKTDLQRKRCTFTANLSCSHVPFHPDPLVANLWAHCPVAMT